MSKGFLIVLGLLLLPASCTAMMAYRASTNVGKSVIAGEYSTEKFEFTNIRIEPYQGARGGADVAGTLVAAYADIHNLSSESAAPSGLEITYSLKDSQQRVYQGAAFQIGIMDEQVKSSNNILPGMQRQNVRLGIFDVNSDASGLMLGIQTGFGNPEFVSPK